MKPTCSICKRPLDIPGDPDSLDCGGDCLGCMVEVEDWGRNSAPMYDQDRANESCSTSADFDSDFVHAMLASDPSIFDDPSPVEAPRTFRDGSPIIGFPYGGWRAPGHCMGSPSEPDPNDQPSDVSKWAWLEENCSGFALDYIFEFRSWFLECLHGGAMIGVCSEYIWFDDETTAILFRIRFGQ